MTKEQIAFEKIRSLVPNAKATVAITLGSGLSEFADHIENPIFIPYADIPGVPVTSVKGHSSALVLGSIHGVPVACLQGRLHLYEGAKYDDMKILIRLLKLLGCHQVLMTNASGSLRPEVPPGSLVSIRDHINFQPGNPLVGPNDDAFGPRFLAMEDTYDKALRASIQKAGKSIGIEMTEGVYISVLGPSFETPAEIRMFRTMGAEVIGMSTVPEVILARHCGLRVSVTSVITNFAAGMTENNLSHEETLSQANASAHKLINLLVTYIKQNQAALIASSAHL